MTAKRLCCVYKSLREDDLYLFVDRDEDLQRVPASLLERFGASKLVMTLALTPERKLARVDAAKVLVAIDTRGYYLQLPAAKDSQLQAMRRKNEKLL